MYSAELAEDPVFWDVLKKQARKDMTERSRARRLGAGLDRVALYERAPLWELPIKNLRDWN